MRALPSAQRKYEARAAARRRLQGNPTGGSTFATWTVSPLRLASCTRRSRERSHVPEDHPLSLRRASPPHDMPQRALARHPPATAARLPWLQPAGESMPATCCPRLPATARLKVGSSVRAVATRERRWLVAEWNGRTARTARASARRAGAAAGARHGRLRASQAPSSEQCSPDLVPSVGPSGVAWGSR